MPGLAPVRLLSRQSHAIASWVENSCRTVPASADSGGMAPAGFGAGTGTLYLCRASS